MKNQKKCADAKTLHPKADIHGIEDKTDDSDEGIKVNTHKSVFVADVVGELQLVEGDDLLHPLLAGGGRVRVDVHPLRHLGVRLAGHHPPTREQNTGYVDGRRT